MDPHPYRVVVDGVSTRAVVVSDRRGERPNLADGDCPLCLGGAESPQQSVGPYAFANRWPALGPGRCEVVAYSSDHDADLGRLSHLETAAVVDLWAARTVALASLPEVARVLVFENRGAEAGATVAHPHSQLFALPPGALPIDPAAPVAEGADCPLCAPADADRLVESADDWTTEVPAAPLSPYAVRISPRRHVGTLADLTSVERQALARALCRAVARMDNLFSLPMPYHLWIGQAPDTHLRVDIVGLRRSASALRVLGAAEMATGLFFSPIAPRTAAATLRATAAGNR